MNNKQSAKKTNHSGHKKVFDVMRPGKAPASPTSRPVIANQKPVADDQFMSGRKMLASDPDEKHELMDAKKRIAVKPVVSSNEEVSPSKDVAEKTLDAAGADEHQAFGAPILDKATLSALTQEIKDKPEAKAETKATPEAPSDIDAKVLLEQLAVEQVVEAPADEAHLHNAPIFTDEAEESPTMTSPAAKGAHAKTIDELLAETGAPQLDTAPESTKPLVSYHSRGHSLFLILMAIIIGAAIGLAILNFLLDAELLDTAQNWPHTDWL